MGNKGLSLVTALLAVALWPAVVPAWAGQEQQPPDYAAYIYNYPHEVPPDYVYRTDRIFAPPPQEASWFDKLIGNTPKTVPSPQKVRSANGEFMRQRVADLVQQLLASAAEEVRDNFTVTVGTFVNANQLYATSSLGRFLSEQLITELQKAGVEVVEVRKTPSILVSRDDGVYGLSSDMDELTFVHNAQAMVVGTYAVAGDEIFVNARLLRNRDGMVLASGSLAFGEDDLCRAMLADEGTPVRAGKPVKIRPLAEQAAVQRYPKQERR